MKSTIISFEYKILFIKFLQRHHIYNIECCGLGLISLSLTQRTGVRFPVRSISWLSCSPGFFLTRKTNVRKFGPHSSPGIIWSSLSTKIILIRLRTQDRLKWLLLYGSTGGLVVSKALSFNINFCFYNRISLLCIKFISTE